MSAKVQNLTLVIGGTIVAAFAPAILQVLGSLIPDFSATTDEISLVGLAIGIVIYLLVLEIGFGGLLWLLHRLGRGGSRRQWVWALLVLPPVLLVTMFLANALIVFSGIYLATFLFPFAHGLAYAVSWYLGGLIRPKTS